MMMMRQVLRRAREVDNLEERMVLRKTDRRLFQREGPITLKDLDSTIVVLAQATRRTRLLKERRGRKDVAEHCVAENHITEAMKYCQGRASNVVQPWPYLGGFRVITN